MKLKTTLGRHYRKWLAWVGDDIVEMQYAEVAQWLAFNVTKRVLTKRELGWTRGECDVTTSEAHKGV